MHGNKVVFSNADRTEIIKRYLADEKKQDIGDLFGVSKNAIEYRLKNWGVSLRTSAEVNEFNTIKLDDYKDEIINRYVRKEKLSAIALSYGVSLGTILNRLKEWDIPRNAKHFYVDEKIKKDIIAVYRETKSVFKTGDYFGVNATTIHKKLVKWGVDTSRKRICSLDDLAFDALTPESLYWFGFLIADGNITISNGRSYVTLTAKEKDHVQKFAKFVGSSHKLVFQNNGWHGGVGAFSSRFISKYMADRLMSYGLMPRKSLTAGDIITNTTILYSKDYQRGLIDGDGCLSWQKSSGLLFPTLTLTSGSPHLPRQFQDFLIHYDLPKGNITTYKRKERDTIYYFFRVTGKKAVKVTDFLYLDANTYLDRKYKLALEFSRRYKQKEVMPT